MSGSDFVLLFLLKNMTNPHPRHEVSYEKHAFACFGNSSISHTQKTCQLGPGAFTHRNNTGGVYREGAFTPIITVSLCSSVVTTELVFSVGLKNRHGHWVFWMPTSRRTISCAEHTHACNR